MADFGLSRGTGEVGAPENGESDGDEDESASYYRSSTGVFPVRWTAPESMETMKFTSASDVWSFGVTLGEIYFDGKQPYKGMKNAEVIHKVQSGYRMPQPADCPASVYAVMRSCWRADASTRPRFAALAESLAKLVDDPNSVEETDIDAAYLHVTSGDGDADDGDGENSYEVPVANNGQDGDGGDSSGMAEYSFATQEVSDDYTLPVALQHAELGSRTAKSQELAYGGAEGDYDAGTVRSAVELTEDSALYELATQEPKESKTGTAVQPAGGTLVDDNDDGSDDDSAVYELASQEGASRGSISNSSTSNTLLYQPVVGSDAPQQQTTSAKRPPRPQSAAPTPHISAAQTKRPSRPKSAAPTPSVSAAINNAAAKSKMPPRPTSIAPTPALAAAVARSTLGAGVGSSPARPKSMAPSIPETAPASIRAALAAMHGSRVDFSVALPAPTPPPSATAPTSRAPAPKPAPPAVATRRSSASIPAKRAPVPVPTRRASTSNVGAPTPARRPSSIVAAAFNDFTTAAACVPKPRPRSTVNVSTAMSGDDVWGMSEDASELVDGLMPALRASKWLKKTGLTNDDLKAIWNESKTDTTVPTNMMSKVEFVKAYERTLSAGGQAIQANSEV